MKKVVICLFFLLISWNLYSLPVDKSGFLLDAGISVDFFTIAELSNSSLWYRTVMPGYRLDCRYNYLTDENKLHRFDFGLKYFESNSFRLNTVELDPGEMRTLIFTVHGGYSRYLPVTANIDYITGIGLAGCYNSFGWVVSSEGARVRKLFCLNVGSVNGISVNITDLFEFSTLLALTGGIPIYGKVEYPGDLEKSLTLVDLGISFRTAATLSLKRFSFSLYYDWSHDYIMSLESESESFTPLSFSSQSVHSIGLQAGIQL